MLFSFQEKSCPILALKVFESVHECLCKQGRGGQEAEMSAGKINNNET
jgi:hypothetical protein